MNGSTPPGASFAFDIGEQALSEQLRRADALDTKAGVLVAANGLVLFGLLLSSNSFVVGSPIGVQFSIVVLTIASLLSALAAFSTRRYDLAPRPESVIRLMARDEAWLRWRFLGNVESAVAQNRRKLVRKSMLLTLSLASLFLTVTTMGLYFVVRTLTGEL